MQRNGAHRDMAKSLSRRSVLSVAAAAAATPAVAAECRIGPPVHPQGSSVWMNLESIGNPYGPKAAALAMMNLGAA
jgi:hypothetical protein